MFNRTQGFTIVELLVVIAVIGILAGIVAVNFSGIQVRARDNERKTDVDNLAVYLETAFQKDGQYPTAAVMTGSVSGIQSTLKNMPSGLVAVPGATVGTNSLVACNLASPPTISQYCYWTPNSASCTSTYTVVDCATFIVAYRKESDNSLGILCGRGANINNAKTIFGGTNGLAGFAASLCSNF